MKKNYIILFLTILFSGITIAQETQKNFINYQGVARNTENQLMAGENMVINIGLKFGTANGASVYEESHSVTTDTNGVFSLLIGNGSPAKGEYNALPWGSAATFVTVSMNGNEIGTTEMMAVPYAISAGSMENPLANEVLYDNSASGLAATTTQDAIDELVTGGSVDADSDPSNEFQTISFNSSTSELSLSNGNTIVIPTDGTDADADPTNEIQTISFDVASNKISLTDGGEITIPSGGTDADADPANELQTLSFDAGSNELSLSDGNSVTIPSGGTDADADPTNEFQTLNFDPVSNELSLSDGNSVTIPSGGTDADADPTNEIQTISFDAGTNELSLTDGGTVTIPSGGTDADADPTNEIQDISLAGTELTISDGSTIDLAPIVPPGGTDNQNLTFNETTKLLEIEDGNTVDLSSLTGGGGSSLWTENGGDISYTSGKVGIGKEDPTAKMHVLHQSNLASPQLRLEESEADYARLEFKNEATGYWHIAGRGGDTGDVSRLNFYHHNGTTGRDYMTIAGSGNIGIGTTSPQVTLDVDGDTRVRGLSGTGERNVMADADGNLVIGAGDGGSSLWEESGNKISYNSGFVGIGEANPTAKLHIKQGYNNSIPFVELESTSGNRAHIRYSNSGNDAYWDQVAGIRTDAASGTMSHYYRNADRSIDNHVMTLRGDKKVGINMVNPTTTLDVNGSFNISGDFANQSVHKVSPAQWNPTSAASGNELPIPGVQLNIDVPEGSKVLLSFSSEALIDADRIWYRILRDGGEIAYGRQSCYTVGGFAAWHIDLDALDINVSAGNHTYSVVVYHSDDADDGFWRKIHFYAVVIKE